MLRKVIAAGILLATAQVARADYQCSVKPQDDITVTAQQVAVSGSNGNLTITPQGEMTFNGKAVTPDQTLRQQAIAYQAAVRRDLPWIDQGLVSVWKPAVLHWIKSSSKSWAAAVMSGPG